MLLTPQQPHGHVVVLVFVTVMHAHHKKNMESVDPQTKTEPTPQEAFAMTLVSALQGLLPHVLYV